MLGQIEHTSQQWQALDSIWALGLWSMVAQACMV